MKECIKSYIRGDEGKVAFRCYSKEEVEDLINIVKEIIYPSNYEGLNFIADDFGKGRYACEMCVRVEYRNGYFDYGKSEAKFYMSRGRKIIDFCDIRIPIDLGEFKAQSDVASLFGWSQPIKVCFHEEVPCGNCLRDTLRRSVEESFR